MKMVPVYSVNGSKILACECDLEYYASIGWTTTAPNESKAMPAGRGKTAKVEEAE